MVPAMPTTASVLKRLEPMTLPRAMSCSPFRAAITDDANSGSEVPIATMVRPMIMSLTPKTRAISTAPQTSRRELAMSSTRPQTSQKTARARGILFSVACAAISSPRASGFRFIPWTMVHVISRAKTASKTAASSRAMERSRISAALSKVVIKRRGSSKRSTVDFTRMG